MERTELLEGAAARLRERLPPSWRIATDPVNTGAAVLDTAIVLTAPNGTATTFVVEAKQELTPRDVSSALSGLGRAVRALATNIPLLFVAPWISPRARELLTAERINYVDLTGNVRVQLEHPALFLSSGGAARDPRPKPRGAARVRGPKAGRLIRMLVDSRPPYGVRDLAAAAGLAPGYVSRMLDTLDREGMVERSPRGGVENVDVASLLRRWAEDYDVLRSNGAMGYISRAGVAEAYAGLGAVGADRRVAVTGSFAAVQLAPVAAPAQLFVYCDDPEAVAGALNLLPAPQAPDVVLLRPFDDVVWTGLRRRTDAVAPVAPSQIVADCLTGTGRMPAEGEAVLEWMMRDDTSWRHDVLLQLTTASR
ncbi:hypothetical protein Cwoe_1586 [Conexibacter woesei DSM 14684]|uniref:HTH iclR-type domain-containing protein n=2 Tax=Conexibacter TaxID=191494 RepID=D3F038_CONWI|nr:hypothetical protein Cwoe_1586 [Conexibacter woesei DSM 14684]